MWIITWVIVSLIGAPLGIFLYDKCGIKNTLDKIQIENSGPIFDFICNVLWIAITIGGFCCSWAFSFDTTTQLENNDIKRALTSFGLAILTTVIATINMLRNHD